MGISAVGRTFVHGYAMAIALALSSWQPPSHILNRTSHSGVSFALHAEQERRKTSRHNMADPEDEVRNNALPCEHARKQLVGGGPEGGMACYPLMFFFFPPSRLTHCIRCGWRRRECPEQVLKRKKSRARTGLGGGGWGKLGGRVLSIA